MEGRSFSATECNTEGAWSRGKESEARVFESGIQLFESVTSIRVLRFTDAEIGTDRKLNRNRKSANIYEQYVLKMEDGPTTKNAAGENRPINLEHMVPRQSELVVINLGFINQVYHLQDSTARADHMVMPYTKDQLVASTVAHEIAHGVDVNHHGDHSRAVQGRRFYEGAGLRVHIFDSQQREIPVSRWPVESGTNRHYYELFGDVGEPGCEESGDINCFMAYTSMYNWSFKSGADGSLNYYMVPLLPIGKTLCTKQAGTNINAMPYYFGTAGRGNCAGQVNFK
jgi:hypothetical protein